MNPNISIIIPAYNAENFLRPTLDSVIAQFESDWELIIVDDGSADQTYRLAQEYSTLDARIKAYQQANAGVARARNFGYSKAIASSTFVIFLDHDDVWERDALTILREALNRDKQAGTAYGLARYIDLQGNIIRQGELETAQRNRHTLAEGKLITWPVEQPTTFEVAAFWSYITTPGQVLIRRSALESQHPFDAEMAPADDWDLWIRLSLSHILFLNQVILNYRLHTSNASSDQQRMSAAALHVRRKYYKSSLLNNQQRQHMLQCYRYEDSQNAKSVLKKAGEVLFHGNLRTAYRLLCQALALFKSSRSASLD